MINFQLRCELRYNWIFAFKQLQKLCKSCHSYQFIETADSRKLCNRSNVSLSLQHKVKRDNRKQVNYKPTFQIVYCNLLAVVNLHHCVCLTVRGVEGENDVDAETHINHSVNFLPVLAIRVIEAEPVGNNYADEDQLNEDKKVPSDFEDVSLRNNILRFALTDWNSIFCIESCEFWNCRTNCTKWLFLIFLRIEFLRCQGIEAACLDHRLNWGVVFLVNFI